MTHEVVVLHSGLGMHASNKIVQENHSHKETDDFEVVMGFRYVECSARKNWLLRP